MKTTKNGQEVQLRNDLVAKGLKALQGNDDPVLFERLKQVAELYSQFGGYLFGEDFGYGQPPVCSGTDATTPFVIRDV